MFVRMPTHCAITCFVFRVMRIDDISVAYFRFAHLFGRPRYVGNVYLHFCTERSEVRVTVCDHCYGWGVTSLLLTEFDPRSGQYSWLRFFWGFSSTVRQMSGKLSPHPSPDTIGHHNHHRSFHTGANDLRCRRALKPKCTYVTVCVIFNSVNVLYVG